MGLIINKLSLEEGKKIESKIVDFIREQVELQKREGVLIGISGGIDSAVVAALAVKAVGKKNVSTLILPDVDSDGTTLEDAKLVTDLLELENVHIEDISPKLEAFGVYSLFPQLYSVTREERQKIISEKKEKLFHQNADSNIEGLVSYRENRNEELRRIRALWNAKIRLRMAMFYFYAEQHNLLVLGTTNKTEYDIGWFTKYGDGGVDIEPIISLYKTTIFELAEYLNIPDRIIKKKPSGDILPGFYDNEGIGISFELLDRILLGFERNMKFEDISKELNVDMDIIKNVHSLAESSTYSRKVPVKLGINM